MKRKKRNSQSTHHPFAIGDSVVVKTGVKDVDLGYDMSGWQGRVIEIKEHPKYPTTVLVEWDSITLENLPGDFIESCELNGMSWESYYLYFEDVESADPRDVQADVKKAIARLSRQNAWLWLGEEGKRINQVLAGINPGDNWKCIKVWYKHLKKVLAFPFEAEVSEFQERGPHQAGDIVRVIDLSEADDHYRVLVDIKKGRLHYVFPLCDLEVTDKDSPQYQPVQDYAIWFANR